MLNAVNNTNTVPGLKDAPTPYDQASALLNNMTEVLKVLQEFPSDKNLLQRLNEDLAGLQNIENQLSVQAGYPTAAHQIGVIGSVDLAALNAAGGVTPANIAQANTDISYLWGTLAQ